MSILVILQNATKYSNFISKWEYKQSIRSGLPFWRNKAPFYPTISHAPPLLVLLPIFTPSLSLHT